VCVSSVRDVGGGVYVQPGEWRSMMIRIRGFVELFL
jgi:hypothetical protein